MQTKQRNRKRLFLMAVLFLVVFSGMSVHADAAWKKNSNGTYSYYENGKKLKKKWIKSSKGTYYVNSKGVRQKGWMYKGKKWYYFSKSGILLRDKWIKYRGNLYYAGKNGAMYTNGMHQVRGKYTYAFNSRGAVQKGRRTYKKKIYYFSTQKNGRMVTNAWVKTKGKYYYYGETGAMLKNQWVGRYYVGKTGQRLTKAWKDDRYLGSNGKAYTGLHKIGKYYYYFDPQTWKKVENASVTVKNKTYAFNSRGRGEVTYVNNVPKPSVAVEDTYYSDKLVNDEVLLASIIYCEAGNQPYVGKKAVGLVLMNRLHDPRFPNKLRELIYADQQFAPARDGSLSKVIKYPSTAYRPAFEECQKAANEIMSEMQNYQRGDTLKLKLGDKTIDFPYLFFMTQPAYQRLGLTDKYRKIEDHVFFINLR